MANKVVCFICLTCSLIDGSPPVGGGLRAKPTEAEKIFSSRLKTPVFDRKIDCLLL